MGFFILLDFSYIYTRMKKYIYFTVFVTSLVMSACGSGSTTTEESDSTAVQVQTGSVTATDSTTSQLPSGGGSGVEQQPVK